MRGGRTAGAAGSLRSGTPQGFYSAIALEKNYELLRNNFLAIEFPDARRGRAVAKNVLSDDPRTATIGGIVHRGGPLLEAPGQGPSDPADCPSPWTTASTPFCTIQQWLTMERATAGLPAMGSGDTLPIVYVSRTAAGTALDEADEELDILLERLTGEVASSVMPAQVAAQVTLLGRFYERLGDHAVNLARRIELLPGVTGDGTDG